MHGVFSTLGEPSPNINHSAECTCTCTCNMHNTIYKRLTLTLTFDLRPWPTIPVYPGSRSTLTPNIKEIGQLVQTGEHKQTNKQTDRQTDGWTDATKRIISPASQSIIINCDFELDSSITSSACLEAIWTRQSWEGKAEMDSKPDNSWGLENTSWIILQGITFQVRLKLQIFTNVMNLA